MNIDKNLDGLLYSGAQEGNGVVHVAIHDATFHPSTDWNHAASLLSLIEEKSK